VRALSEPPGNVPEPKIIGGHVRFGKLRVGLARTTRWSLCRFLLQGVILRLCLGFVLCLRCVLEGVGLI